MKKFLLALVALIGIGTTVSAQGFQIQAGYGGYTQMDATNMADGGNVNTAWGAVTAGFLCRITPSMRIGASYTFSSASYKNHDNANVFYHAVLGNIYYDIYRNGNLKLYSHVGLGIDVSHMAGQAPNGHWSYNQTYFAFQTSPLGAEYNIGSGCNLFGELGYGAQGLLQVGVRVSL